MTRRHTLPTPEQRTALSAVRAAAAARAAGKVTRPAGPQWRPRRPRQLHTVRKVFNPRLLPTPAQLLARLGITFPAGSGSHALSCPFHEDAGQSFSMCGVTGEFHCPVCGARGRELITFIQKLYHLSFRGAVTKLNAWEVLE